MKTEYLEYLLFNKFVVYQKKNSNFVATNEQIAAILHSFHSLGFSLDDDSITLLKTIGLDEINIFYHQTYEVMSKAKGANVKHTIFYKNFPNMEGFSEEEYAIRAILHYLTASKDNQGFMNQDITDESIREEIHNDCYDMVHLLDEEEAIKKMGYMITAQFESKTAIPYSYHQLFKNFIRDYKELVKPEVIPFKENIAHFISFHLEEDKKVEDAIQLNTLRFVQTPTDLLRVYAVLSQGDVQLKTKVFFKSLSRKLRRLFLAILNEMAATSFSVIEDLARHEFLWKRAFEKLHVGEYELKYPYIYKEAHALRTGEYQTYYGKLASAENQSFLLNLLSERPGEFARRLDMLLRNKAYDATKTLKAFDLVADKVSTPVLYSLIEHFENRNLFSTRVFCIKGLYMKYMEIEENREDISDDLKQKAILIIKEALYRIYSKMPRLEKVFVEDSLKNYALPINVRNASKGHQTLTFGSRVKLEMAEGSFLRFFTHWKNMPGNDDRSRVDIDLSIELVNEDFSNCISVAWHSMGVGKKFSTFHSGDIVTAPNGASEFVDLDYAKARKYGRYVIVCNYVYTSQNFCDIPECFSGVMQMSSLGKKGEVFHPEFVKYKFDLTQKGANSIISFAVDLETMEMIWMDCPRYYGGSGLVASLELGVIQGLKTALKKRISLYDLVELHKGHLSFVEDFKDAAFIIGDSSQATITPFELYFEWV